VAEPVRAVICIMAESENIDVFDPCLERILAHTPVERLELRLAFGGETDSFHYALGTLCPADRPPRCYKVPGWFERFDFMAVRGMRVYAWVPTRPRSREQLARMLYHNVPLDAEYVVCVEQAAQVDAGWWDRLTALMEKRIDLIGQPAWHEYLPGEAEPLALRPWYMGVPLARRQGRAGAVVVREGLFAVRGERLRAASYPEPGSGRRAALRLAEMAHQLGWSTAEFAVQGATTVPRGVGPLSVAKGSLEGVGDVGVEAR
jgi:hypothetical protein